MKEIITLMEQIVREQEEKGGVEAAPTAKKDTKNLGIDLGEIASILMTGTESEKIRKSSVAALNTLMANANIEINFSSAETLVDSFKFFDLKSEEVLTEKCSSLGGLVSKFALTAGLISILEQFNAVSAGFVNEAYIATLMGGKSVPVGAGGIEDIAVQQNGERVGISLKTKVTEKLGGSFGNLLETLSIPYSLPADKQIKRIRGEDTKTGVDGDRRFVKPPENPVNPGGLYYLSFIKQDDGMTIAAYKIKTSDIIGSAKPDENGFYNIEELNNVLASKSPDVEEKAYYTLGAALSPQDFNDALRSEMSEVFDSLMVLDGWYGEFKEMLINYISTLDRSSFDEFQNYLDSGSNFTFKAFSQNACDQNMMQENKNNSLSELELLMEQVVREIIS